MIGATTAAWTIGRGGLLGQHTARELARFHDPWHPPQPFSWGDPALGLQLTDAVRGFARHADGRPWRVAWCAGAGVVGSGEGSLRLETAALAHLLNAIERAVAGQRLADDGKLFFASSAGALYAGSDAPPFDERSQPRPLAPYGHAKLAQEDAVVRWTVRTGLPAIIGRIANLYGPGQDLTKPQGLISQLCWTQIRQEPLTIFVPLATMRDYVFAPDCARLVARTLRRPTDGARVKVIATQRAMSIGLVLGEFRRVIRRNARISVRASPRGRFQVVDLRLRSFVDRDLDSALSTTFAVGLRATYNDLLSRFALAPSASSASAGRHRSDEPRTTVSSSSNRATPS